MISNELVLVCCSGGFDSTMTLATLKLAGYDNIIACHFKYGHRGQDAEHSAIKSVCEELNIPLRLFDIQNIYNEIQIYSLHKIQFY